MISVRSVSKSFGRVQAVRAVSFEVARGEVVGLVGANGAGKTTTIRIITGFLPPDGGSVSVVGHDTMEQSLAARRCIGYLPESAPAYSEMAASDYLDYRGRLHRLPRADRRAAVERAMDLCELRDVRQRRIGQLSRGYRQRVGLAAAILHNPPVLVLDEPTSALDPRQIRHTRSLVRDLAKDRAVLISSHILPEVERTCDRVVIMVRGAVRADASPAALLATARDEAPYIVEARGAKGPNHATEVLRSIPGIIRVESLGAAGDGWAGLKLSAASGRGDLREAIAGAAATSGVLIRELRRETPGLERLFLDLIETDDAGARTGGAPAASSGGGGAAA